MRNTSSSFLVRLFGILSAVVAVHASALADGDKAPPARSPRALEWSAGLDVEQAANSITSLKKQSAVGAR